METPNVTYLKDLDPAMRSRVETLASQVEKPHDRLVYGQKRQVEPNFCRTVIGDGANLLIVTPLQTVPHYYAILVDSSWVKPSSHPLVRSGLEADLDDPDRSDLIVDTLIETFGDGDVWEEENDYSAPAPRGMFHRDMGFRYGIEPLTEEGLLADP